jgi:hypothetical protein
LKHIQAARASVLAIFFLHGAVFATWISRIPAVKSAIGLSTGQLGVSLLGIAAGCIISMPLTGYVVSRFGSRSVTAMASLFFCVALIAPGFATSQWTLGAALCLLGLAAGGMDVGMNAHGVLVERSAGRPLMSGFHAMFSIGGMAGAALGGMVAGLGISPRAHFIGASVISLAVTLVAIPGLLPGSADAIEHGRSSLKLSWTLAGLGALTFCFFLSEGAIADWSALYLNTSTGATAGRAAAGYALFSAAMSIGRLSGDRLRHLFGAAALVRTGSITAAAGLALALAIPITAVSLLGFTIVGAGCCIVVPIVFAATGGLKGTGTGAALAFVTTSGYIGLFAGPPAIGFVAEAFTLRLALGIVVVLVGLGTVLAAAVRGADLH